MKSFVERSPIVIGIITLLVIAGGTIGAIALDSGLFDSTYRVEAQFVDSSGIRPGDKVVVAGVREGEVASVELAPDGETVLMSLKVNSGVELPRNTEAEIQVDTLLGSKSVALKLPVDNDPDWSQTLQESGQRIPVERTDPRSLSGSLDTPFEGIDLQDVGTELAAETDAEALNQLLASLADVTDGARDDVTAVITNLDDITTAVNEREAEARDLLDAAAEVSGVLADRDQELIELIDDLAVVVKTLDDKKGDLVALLEETAATSEELGDLLGDHRADLDAILADLDRTLEVIDRRQLDLAAGVAYSASAIEGFSSIGYAGPNRTPHPWANIFLGSAGPGGVDPLLGACGMLDIALDAMLGPDPKPCTERDGPVSAGSGEVPEGSSADPVHRSGTPDDGSGRPLIERVLDFAGEGS